MSAHRLDPANTYWLFLSDSAEPRHLHDIVYGADVLRQRGVGMDRIIVFTDHPTPSLYLAPYGVTNIEPLTNFSLRLQGLQGCTNVVVIVTGHGNPLGIGAGTPIISPHQLLSAVRAIPGLAVGVIVLAQCYAGIFDRVDAETVPPLVLVGATSLNLSLSANVTLRRPVALLDGTPGLRDWLANIFLVCFFEWLSGPRDVDGDGALTIADAYKFAGTQSNSFLVQIKSGLYLDAAKLAARVQELEADPNSQVAGSMEQLQLAASTTELQGTLTRLHLHQEAWILHAKLSRDIGFT